MESGSQGALLKVPDAAQGPTDDEDRVDLAKPLLLAGLLAAICLVVVLYQWNEWTPTALFVIPIIVALAIGRYSLLAAVYVATMGVLFGLTAMILGSDPTPVVVPIVLLSCIAVGLGAVAVGTRLRLPTVGTWPTPGWVHFVVVAFLIGLQAVQLLNGQSGLTAQLNGTSDSGSVVSLVVGAGSTMTLMLFLVCLAEGRHALLAAVLMAAQILVFSLGGSRGVGPLSLISIAVAASLVLPATSKWRSKKRLLACLIIGLVAGFGLFNLGAEAKDAATINAKGRIGNSFVFSPDETISKTAERLELNPPLEKAIAAQDDIAVQDALGWQNQVIAVVPRILWPEKPAIDYSQQVSVTVYGLPYGLTSTSISRVGDTLVNFGVGGIIAVGVIVGCALAASERFIRHRRGIVALALAAGLSQEVLAHESPVIIATIGAIRGILLAAVFWWLCQIASTLFSRRGSRAPIDVRASQT